MTRAFYILLACLLTAIRLTAQVDSMDVDAEVQDTLPPLPPVAFHLQEFGASWVDGNMQFFEGYDARILYADAQSGLPIYPDWGLYSRIALLPTYYQFGLHAGLVDTIRGVKLRLSAMYSHREDSMNYASDFQVNDTVYGRIASEKGSFMSFGLAGIKQSRKLLGFIRFHGGAEIELGFSPRSNIDFTEYAADIGDQVYVQYNQFQARGKPRFNAFATAILAFETVFFKHFGIVCEIKSGLGYQLVVKEKAFGMGRTTYRLGLNYYLFDYNRKALPRQLPPHRSPNEPEQPPSPQF